MLSTQDLTDIKAHPEKYTCAYCGKSMVGHDLTHPKLGHL